MPVSKRVVVTGLGVVSPIGIGADVFWKAALAGRSGISALPPWQDLPELPLGGYRSQVAGQVLDFDTADLPKGVQPDRYDRYAQLALLATKEAVADSGLRIERENPHRVGVIMGAGMGGMLIGEEEFAKVYMDKRPSVPPTHPMITPTRVGHHRDDVPSQGTTSRSRRVSSSDHAIGLSWPRSVRRPRGSSLGGEGPHPWLAGFWRSVRCRPRTTISPRGPPARSSARATDS